MQRIGKNIFSLGLSRVVSGIVLFLVYIRLVTYLGPNEFGKLSLVMAYYTIFLLLVDLGISRFVIKRMSEDKTLAPTYLGNFFVAQFLLSLVVLGIFMTVPRLFGYEPELRMGMLLCGFGLLLGSMSLPYASLLQAWQKIHLVAAVNFLNTMINAAWLLLAIVLHESVVFIFWLYIILGVVDFVIYAVLSRSLARPSFRVEPAVVKVMILSGLPFAFISGFEILISKLDVVIQKFFLPYQQIGLYAGAYRFLDFLTFIPAIVAISLFPFLSENSDLRIPVVESIVSRLNRYMIALALPMGVGATILADKIILTLFDQSYLGAARVFQVLIWSTVLTFFYAAPGIIVVVKKTHQAAGILLGVVAFNAAGNWLLIPRYGIIASAWLTVFSYLLMSAAYIGLSRQIANFTLFRHVFWPAVGSAVMGVCLWFMKDLPLPVAISVSAAVYFCFLAAVRFIRKEDWRNVKSIFAKDVI